MRNFLYAAALALCAAGLTGCPEKVDDAKDVQPQAPPPNTPLTATPGPTGSGGGAGGPSQAPTNATVPPP